MPKLLFKRTSGVRDAKLVVIATEGLNTEPKYFKDLACKYRCSKIHVEITKRGTTASSPEHVLSELNKFKREYRLNKYDEMWMVVDKDRWPEKNLAQVATKCVQKKINLAVSNPCFELWLLLHIADIATYRNEEKQSLNQSCQNLEKELRKVLGSYNKEIPDTSRFLPTVGLAIQRAKALDLNPKERWPQSLGTRVYILVEKLIA